MSDLPEITRVPKKKKRDPSIAVNENKENEKPSSEKQAYNEEKDPNNVSIVNNNSISPERKIKVESYEGGSHNSPKRAVEHEEEKQSTLNTNNENTEKPAKKKQKRIEPPVMENNNAGSNRRGSLDNSLNDIHVDKEQKQGGNPLPVIKNYSKNNSGDYEHQMKIDNSGGRKEKKYNHSLEK